MEPRPEDYEFDLERAIASMVGITSTIPEDAMTADVLGTERSGNGVIIGDGLILTIGYLVTEAETIWLSLADGSTVQGHVLGYDQESGFGLIQALARLQQPGLPLGDSDSVRIGESVVVCGHGGLQHSVAASVVAKQEFAGYWEYVLDEAIFTSPAHPHWGGTAVVNQEGELVGIGSLQVQHAEVEGENVDLNMIVPINLLKPILQDLRTIGRRAQAARPWIGLYAADVGDNIVVAGIATGGPSDDVDLNVGDIIMAVEGEEVSDLATFFRKIWSLGPAGVEVPLHIHREGRAFEVAIESVDRRSLLKGPIVH
ncbi:MAG: S1C family serine protease [Hyphomicrobiaceae bacterium]